MINCLKPGFREFLPGKLVINENVKKAFKYSIVTEEEKQWNTPIKNLISSQGNTVVKTSWDLPFKDNQQVYLNGELFLILRCKRMVTDINEQSLALLRSTFSAYWVLEVTR